VIDPARHSVYHSRPVDFRRTIVCVVKEQQTGLSITYSDPVVSYTDGASVLPERAGGERYGIKKLGIIRGFTPVSWAGSVSSGDVELVVADSFDSLILQALRGRVDAIYANTAVVDYQVGRRRRWSAVHQR